MDVDKGAFPTPLSCTIPVDLKIRLQDLANAQDKSISAVVIELIEAGFKVAIEAVAA